MLSTSPGNQQQDGNLHHHMIINNSGDGITTMEQQQIGFVMPLGGGLPTSDGQNQNQTGQKDEWFV